MIRELKLAPKENCEIALDILNVRSYNQICVLRLQCVTHAKKSKREKNNV